MTIPIEDKQREICSRFGADFCPTANRQIAGVAADVSSGVWPMHGLRHPRSGNTTGWYIWAGDYSEATDFFEPLHVEHLRDRCPEVLRYLGLPPGWRFLIAPGHEDVWFDPTLLEI